MTRRKGLFITFEGGEGCGKSTQIIRTANYLRSLGYGIVQTREPGGSLAAETIRSLILQPWASALAKECELLLFLAARAEHIDKVIRPALEQGKIVLCDRFSDSTFAYQGVNGDFSMETMEMLNAFATGGEIIPDITLLLDGDTEQLLGRREARGTKDRFEAKDLSFHKNIRTMFLEMQRNDPQRIKLVDALQDPDAVQEDIRKILAKPLKSKKLKQQ